MIDYRTNPHPDAAALDDFWQRAWGGPPPPGYARVLERSLAHIGAYERDCLIGFVNLAWDGGLHAFVLDTAVDELTKAQEVYGFTDLLGLDHRKVLASMDLS